MSSKKLRPASPGGLVSSLPQEWLNDPGGDMIESEMAELKT